MSATDQPRPRLHLTNWSSRRLHGPGRRLTIMREPRAWEHGEGRVSELLPKLADLRAVKVGTLPIDEYMARCEAVFRGWPLSPGELYTTADGGGPVRDGDTLCCACSRSDAAAGRCHRVAAARLLVEAGWAVTLDGAEVDDVR